MTEFVKQLIENKKARLATVTKLFFDEDVVTELAEHLIFEDTSIKVSIKIKEDEYGLYFDSPTRYDISQEHMDILYEHNYLLDLPTELTSALLGKIFGGNSAMFKHPITDQLYVKLY